MDRQLIMTDLEPMPSIPAMPAAAPSFAERLSTDGRPQTEPSQPIHIPRRQKSFAEAVARFHEAKLHSRQPSDEQERPLAPPLPLVLRPPLRKKKSFSRVSSWLFPTGEEPEGINMDTVTNLPRPVTDKEGFYQCVAPERLSMDSLMTESSHWETEGEDEEKSATIPTTWSPGSSPVVAQETPTSMRPRIDIRMGTFGKSGGYRPQSVGVAM